ncbi:P-loop NTPase fold protein [Lentzea sp. NEAU-D7]|uniref:P-loop NTPase fold protein n=1 Tax=Lentzea sp. NEAU-D7 TaxID=2994667 RepID=UPI00224A5EB2|nr:P-loop NTPase fold protein [Lentzea sp. NEAU-D7]MCX2953873.1 P-loop NTPase fold protein [Lentzea sp. NEAU-D7]
MTSADVPHLELERTIVLGATITGLSVDRAEPRLTVYFEGGSAETVNLFTGAREQLNLKFAEGLFPPHRTVRIADLVATAEETVIVIRRNNREIHRLAGHTSSVTSLAVCPAASQPLLVSGSEGGSVRLWNPRTGELLNWSEPSRVSALVTYLGPDGRARIASGSRTGRLRIWDPLLPPPHRIGSVSTRGFSDHVAQEDLLDRGTLVEALRDVLRPGDDDGPSVITVEGAWGSGKSTLLELVRNRLRTPPTPVKPMRRFTVRQADRMLYRPPAGMEPRPQEPTKIKPMIMPLVAPFNPWRHQSSEQVWAGLAKAVTEAAESAIMPEQNNRDRYWFTRNAGRVDRRHLQRQLWRRIFSPLLSFAGLGFGLSALGALSKLNVGWAWWVTAGLAAAGLVHTGFRYFFAKAAGFLPGELFAGPVTSTVFAGTTTDPLIRDPYYNARSGYLYLVQHDIKTLLKDLETQVPAHPAHRRPRPVYAAHHCPGVRGDQRLPVGRLPHHEVRAGSRHHRGRIARRPRLS